MSVLETQRLRLRPAISEDAALLRAIWIDEEVRRFLWDGVIADVATAQQVVEESCESWRERGYGLWIVYERDGDVAIGFTAIRESEEGPELIFGLLPAYWHRGYATEAAHAVLEYVALPRVWAEADVPNAASMRVLERLGMTHVRNRVVDGRETAVYVISRT